MKTMIGYPTPGKSPKDVLPFLVNNEAIRRKKKHIAEQLEASAKSYATIGVSKQGFGTKQQYDKNAVLNTPFSFNFKEAEYTFEPVSNYKDRSSPSASVNFKLYQNPLLQRQEHVHVQQLLPSNHMESLRREQVRQQGFDLLLAFILLGCLAVYRAYGSLFYKNPKDNFSLNPSFCFANHLASLSEKPGEQNNKSFSNY